MFRLPSLEGIIKRRMLINFSADAEVVQRILPAGFRPKLHQGEAIVGICLIRLESIRPKGFPNVLGQTSENAAHRVAVEWTSPEGADLEGVYIPRRDTSSSLNALAGGRLFPGEHHHSRFRVEDDGDRVFLEMKDSHGLDTIQVRGRSANQLPATSRFSSLAEASAFFEKGCVGYSATSDPRRMDGIRLCTTSWEVRPLEVDGIYSRYFEDEGLFPQGSITFDHALIMRDIAHEWRSVPDFPSPT